MFEFRPRTLLIQVVAALSALAAAGVAAAQNSIALEAATAQVAVGQPFAVDLNANFSTASVGGAVALVYDPALLSLDSVAFTAGDADFQCPGSLVISCPADPNYLSWGDVAGFSGATGVATLTFTPLDTGIISIGLQSADAFGAVGGGEVPMTTVSYTHLTLPTKA